MAKVLIVKIGNHKDESVRSIVLITPLGYTFTDIRERISLKEYHGEEYIGEYIVDIECVTPSYLASTVDCFLEIAPVVKALNIYNP
jgi:hypothetical protein